MSGDPYEFATLEAGEVLDRLGITSLPVDPIAVAISQGIEVRAKPTSAEGVSGMLIRVGNEFCIAYASHIDNEGFRNFSVAHELGHFFLPGHADAVFDEAGIHRSRAGFASGDRYELEADHFAAGFLMPAALFTAAMNRSGDGLAAIETLAGLCKTSLEATAIRYTQCTDEAAAIVLSTGKQINYCFMSEALKNLDGLDWIRRRDFLPKNTATFTFNQDDNRVRRGDRTEGTSDLQDWFNGPLSVEITEEVVGLGRYGKTLTVLTARDLPDEEEIQEEEEFNESWQPKFKR